jgi:hypothetical protein
MNITAVESNTPATVGYDDAHELLQLEFRSGAKYRYCGNHKTVASCCYCGIIF